MCGVPSHNLEMYVEKLRDKYDVTIAEAPDFRSERHIYTLRSIDHEAEAAINAYEAEFGADGTRVFRDPAAEQVQPTVQELFDGYKLTVGNALPKIRLLSMPAAIQTARTLIWRVRTLSVVLSRYLMISSLSACTLICPRSITGCIRSFLEELYPTLAATVAPLSLSDHTGGH